MKYSQEHPTDEQLLRLITNGDSQAFEQLYDRYFRKFKFFALRFLNNEVAAEDEVQELFMTLIHKSDQYDPSYQFSTWAYTMLANRCKNQIRNEKRRAEILTSMSGDTEFILDAHDHKQAIQVLKTWMENQSEKEQMLFSLRFEQQLSLPEIAEIMQIPLGSVKSGLYYLTKRIREPFKKLNYDG